MRCLRLAAVVLFSLLGGCFPLVVDTSPSFRLTVEVNDGGIVRSGSQVWKVERRSWLWKRNDVIEMSRARGDAIPIRLTHGVLLIVPGSRAQGLPERLWTNDYSAWLTGGSREPFSEYIKRKGQYSRLGNCPDYKEFLPDRPGGRGVCFPMFMVEDVSNPKSFKRVTAAQLADEAHGNVQLLKMVLTFTDDSVTRSVLENQVPAVLKIRTIYRPGPGIMRVGPLDEIRM